MIRRLWLLFSQTVTVLLGVVLVAGTLTEREFSFGPSDDLRAGDFSAAVAKAAPAVVTIFAQHHVPGGQTEQIGSTWNKSPENEFTALGSGVIISRDGLILTNYHVVAAISGLNVTLQNGKSYEATTVGFDIDTDLALLRIKADDLPTAVMGKSDELRVGQAALAIGNPFEVGQTVTSGIISALGRHGLGLNSYEDFIQTDAAINQGNSGGALINAKGELIGINTAIFSPQNSEGFVGIGFAIPTSLIERVLPSMKAGQSIERGYFGLIPKQLSKEFAQDLGLSRRYGVMVDRILPGSPAGRAGLLPFDILLTIKDEPVKNVNDMLKIVASIEPEEIVPVTVLRGRNTLTIQVTTGRRPAREADEGASEAIADMDIYFRQ